MSIMSRPSSTNAECSRDCFACIDCDLGWAVGRRGGGGQGGQIIGTRFRMVRLSPCIGREIFICRQLLLLCRAWAPAMQTRAIAFGMLKRCRVCC